LPGRERVPPCLVGVLGQREIGLLGIDAFDLAPEAATQIGGELAQGGVVDVMAAPGEVGDQHFSRGRVADLTEIDQLGRGHRR
jgi:hypothetical protein